MSEHPPSDLSEALRWLRERIGLSRDQLATASGVSAVHIKFIERGKRNPSEAVVERLLPALRVTRADLDGLVNLRPWASSTASGEPATLAAYSAGIPLTVHEGAEFDAAPAPAPAPAPAAGPVFAAAPPPQAAPRPEAAPPPTGSTPRTRSLARAAFRSAPPGGLPPPAPPAPRAQPASRAQPAPPAASAAPPLEAELIELRERYVHLPRSKQQMVLGWLRALDDR